MGLPYIPPRPTPSHLNLVAWPFSLFWAVRRNAGTKVKEAETQHFTGTFTRRCFGRRKFRRRLG